MNFSELESLMSSRGVTSLADIARALSTTPQAVSNWKARNQVPHHIVVNLNKISQSPADSPQSSAQPPNPQFTTHSSPLTMEEDTISLSDLLLTLAEQIKVIFLVTFITVFLTFTHVQFIKQSLYISWATVLLPDAGRGDLGGLLGIASQFGVNVPMESTADLSSPSLYPELLRSRTFAEKILEKEFYLDKYGKKLPLLDIITDGDKPSKLGRETLIAQAVNILNGEYLEFVKPAPAYNFSVIRVTTPDPVFSKELTEVVLNELEALSRYFRSQTVSEKTNFIKNRIASVKEVLEHSEQQLKEFNQQNRQISSPALQLELDHLARDVEVQKSIYLTLRQQLELAKIEEVQKTSIVQILDKPQIPIGPSNKNLMLSIILSGILGVVFGILLGFLRSYLNNSNMDERRKLRRVRNFVKKKGKDLVLDRRISGIVSVLLIIGLPFYLGYESQNPVFFGIYSSKLMLVNTVYILTLFTSISLFIYLSRKKT